MIHLVPPTQSDVSLNQQAWVMRQLSFKRDSKDFQICFSCVNAFQVGQSACVRDWIRAKAAATYASLGQRQILNPPCQPDPSRYNQILNPLCHSRISKRFLNKRKYRFYVCLGTSSCFSKSQASSWILSVSRREEKTKRLKRPKNMKALPTRIKSNPGKAESFQSTNSKFLLKIK